MSTDAARSWGPAGPTLVAVADDDPVVLSFIEAVIARDGRFSVVSATSGVDAVDLCKRMVPKVLILDAMMPGYDGFQVAAMLRGDSATADTKIIMLTALKERSDIFRTFDSGADRYVAKPVTPKRLIAEIESVLRPVSDFAADSFGPRKGDRVVLRDGRWAVMLSKLPPGKWMGEGWGYLVRLEDGGVLAVEAQEATAA